MIDYVSFFSGIGCAEEAIKRVFGKKKARCLAISEIKKASIECWRRHHGDAPNLGPIEEIDIDNLKLRPTLFIAGFPCVSLSILRGKRKHLDGPGSILFYPMIDALEKMNPEYFIIENVASMSDEVKDEISSFLGVEPILINSCDYTGQNRPRYYWINFPITSLGERIERRTCRDHVIREWVPELEIPQKEFKKLFNPKPDFKLWKWNSEDERNRVLNLQGNHDFLAYSRSTRYKQENGKKVFSHIERRVRMDDNSNCLTGGAGFGSFSNRNYIMHDNKLRYLHPVEAERLQGLPDGYTSDMKKTTRNLAIGKGMTVDVIEDILWNLKEEIG